MASGLDEMHRHVDRYGAVFFDASGFQNKKKDLIGVQSFNISEFRKFWTAALIWSHSASKFRGKIRAARLIVSENKLRSELASDASLVTGSTSLMFMNHQFDAMNKGKTHLGCAQKYGSLFDFSRPNGTLNIIQPRKNALLFRCLCTRFHHLFQPFIILSIQNGPQARASMPSRCT